MTTDEALRDLILDLLDYKRDEDSIYIAGLLLDIQQGRYVQRHYPQDSR